MIKNKVGVIVLSRYSSSRLPGKALLEIREKPVLLYIIERIREVLDNNNIVIATSIENSDNPIVSFANKHGIKIFRGSLENVSERFYSAAKKQDWEYAIRINGDNIFLDIPLLKLMKKKVIKSNFDFLSNVKNRTYPKGMSVEIVKLSYYESLLEKIKTNKSYLEHVMQHIYEESDLTNHYYFYNSRIKNVESIQLALDTHDDFKRSSIIINNFKKNHINYNLEEIISILKNG